MTVPTLLLVALSLPMSRQAGATPIPTVWHPIYKPGDIYLATRSSASGAAGLIRVDGRTGACSPHFLMQDVLLSYAADFAYDAGTDRLVTWGSTGLSTYNFGNALYFVDVEGHYTYMDLPQGLVPTAIACNGAGRTYMSFSGPVWFVEGVGPAFTLQPLMNLAGTGVYDLSPYNAQLGDFRYLPRLNVLVSEYRDPVTNPFVWSVGLHVLPLTTDGRQVAGPATTYLWTNTDDLIAMGTSPMLDGRLFVSMGTSCCGQVSTYSVDIDPITLAIQPSPCATFGAPFHRGDAATYSWLLGEGLILDTGGDSLYESPCGSSGVGSSFGGSGCVSSPMGSAELASMEVIPSRKVRRP